MSLFALPTVTAIIGTVIDLNKPYRWVRIEFTMPNITNPKNGQIVTGGELITVDKPVNFTGATLLTQQNIADAFAEAYSQMLINREIQEIINA
jgi:hypothetical protein